MEYNVKITETLVKIVKVDADSPREAKNKVKEAYLDEKVVLSANDYVCHDIEVMEDYKSGSDPSEPNWEKV